MECSERQNRENLYIKCSVNCVPQNLPGVESFETVLVFKNSYKGPTPIDYIEDRTKEYINDPWRKKYARRKHEKIKGAWRRRGEKLKSKKLVNRSVIQGFKRDYGDVA